MSAIVKVMIRLIVDFIIHEIRSLHRRISPIPLTSAEKMFIKENSTFWSKYINGCLEDKYVLIEFSEHPAIFLSNASFGSIVAHSRNLKLLFVLESHVKTSERQILASYPNSTFVYLTGWRYFVRMFRAWFEAKTVCRSLQTPEDLLKLEVDGMPVGHIIYDVVLSVGYATIQRIDEKVFGALYSFFQMRNAIKDIIRRYAIETAVVSQLMGLRGGTFAKYLLQSEIEILNRVGSHQILLKKYHALNDMGNHPTTPVPEYFSLMIDNDDGTVQRMAEEYLEQRLGGGVSRVDAALAFHPMKKTFIDRQSFCAENHLDSAKPIVFVMLHAFNDCPHWNYPKNMLFLDYYHWFMRTLEIAQKVQSVNWIFKEHPTQRFYPTIDLDIKAIMEQVNSSHIRFLDGQANFNTGSLRYLAHAVVTGMGTAGLEFSAYGIPCILAGECSYSGFGFTIEPKDAKEYEHCLRHIDHLHPLSSSQVKAAKVVLYFYFCIMGSHPYYFCPCFGDDEISEWRSEYSESLWKKAADNFQNAQHVEKMRRQVQELSRFVCDDSKIQYIDLNRYAFLRSDIAGEDVSD